VLVSDDQGEPLRLAGESDAAAEPERFTVDAEDCADDVRVCAEVLGEDRVSNWSAADEFGRLGPGLAKELVERESNDDHRPGLSVRRRGRRSDSLACLLVAGCRRAVGCWITVSCWFVLLRGAIRSAEWGSDGVEQAVVVGAGMLFEADIAATVLFVEDVGDAGGFGPDAVDGGFVTGDHDGFAVVLGAEAGDAAFGSLAVMAGLFAGAVAFIE